MQERADSIPIIYAIPIRKGWPKLDKPRFPVAPELFIPMDCILVLENILIEVGLLNGIYQIQKLLFLNGIKIARILLGNITIA